MQSSYQNLGGFVSKQKVKVIKAGTSELPVESFEQNKRILANEAKRKSYTLLPDKIAGDSFYMRNQPLPKGKELFPLEWRLQYAEIFYPYAQGGPLYLDVATTDYDKALCERKLKELKKTGIRYCYLTPQMDFNEAMQQLESELK